MYFKICNISNRELSTFFSSMNNSLMAVVINAIILCSTNDERKDSNGACYGIMHDKLYDI